MHSRDHFAHLGLSRPGSLFVGVVADGGFGVRAAGVARVIAIPFHSAANRCDGAEKNHGRQTAQGLAKDISWFATVRIKKNKINWTPNNYNDISNVFRKYGIREDHQYSEVLALCRFCCCLFWPSAGHPCIADQSPDFRARLKEAGSESDSQPVPPAQFLKYFSL